jgi:hypothetical protein
VAIPERVLDLLRAIGQVAAEVPGSHDDVRAFVAVWRFRPEHEPGAAERYRYLGRQEILYRARRFQMSREVLDNEYDVSEDDLWDSQSVVLPDESAGVRAAAVAGGLGVAGRAASDRRAI